MNHMEVIQPAIQPIIQMDQKDHIEDIRSHETKDIGSHEAKFKLDGLYLNHEVNVLNVVLQDFLKNIWANHAYEDPKYFEDFCGSQIEAKWALFNILAFHVFDDYG